MELKATRSEKISLIVVAIAAIVGLYFLITFVSSTGRLQGNADAFRAIIEAKDSTISEIRRSRDIIEASKNAEIEQALSKARGAVSSVKSNAPKYIQSQKDEENISVIVRSLTKDSLRRAIYGFQ